MIALSLALVSALACGALVAARLLEKSALEGVDRLLWSLAWSVPLGLGTLSILVFACRLLGLPRPGPEGLAGLAAIGLAILRPRRPRRPLGREQERSTRLGAPRLPRPLAALAWAALALAMVGGVRSFAQLTRHQDKGSWDAVAVWNARARLLERGWDRFPALLAAVDRTSHPNYPLGLPASVAGLEIAAGGESQLAPAAVAAAWSLSALLLLFLTIRAVASVEVAALATAWVLSTPISVTWAAAQVADVPIAALLLGVLATLASRLPDWRGPVLPSSLAGFGLGLLPWLKNDGLPVALLIGGVFLAVRSLGGPRTPERRTASPLELATMLGGAAPGLAATLLFKCFWSPGSGLETYFQGSWGDRLFDWHRWLLPAREIAVRLFAPSPSWWFLVWIVPGAGILLALALGAARRRCFLFPVLALGAIVASWLPIYASTPYPLAWHVASSIDRLLLQLLPAALATAAVGLSAITFDTDPSSQKRSFEA